MVLGDRPFAGERGRDRCRQACGQRGDLRPRGRMQDAAAGQHERPAGAPQHLRHRGDVGRLGRGPERGEGTEPPGHSLLRDRGGGSIEHVLRQQQRHRARPSAGCLPEGMADQARHRRRVRNAGQPLGHGSEQGGLIKRLGGRRAVAVRRHPGRQVTDQGNNRHRRAQGLAQAGRKLGRSRPHSGIADACPPGHPRIGIGRVGARPLVPHQHVRDGRRHVEYRVIQGQRLTARHPEHVADAVLGQQAHEQGTAVAAVRAAGLSGHG